MSDDDAALPGRVRRAFRDHDAFELDGRVASATSTPFEAEVRAVEAGDGRIRFEVTVRVPMLDSVTEDDVADVVEEGWYETFVRRVEDVGDITRGDADPSPTVDAGERQAVVRTTLSDIDERRGVDDAAAVVDYVEGTYVQGVIPGYEYTPPVTDLVSRARRTGESP